MALKDKSIPNEVNYSKLRDFPDGEIIEVVGCGVNEEAKFGPMPYFVAANGERISLPTRYVDYVLDILNTPEYIEEMRRGLTIVKHSRDTRTGGVTPTFDYV